MCTTYNGWTNYPTWAIALWIENDEGDQEQVAELVNAQENIPAAADVLEAWVDDALEVWQEGRDTAGMFYDLLTWAIANANWVEIAEAFWDAEQHQDEEAAQTV